MSEKGVVINYQQKRGESDSLETEVLRDCDGL